MNKEEHEHTYSVKVTTSQTGYVDIIAESEEDAINQAEADGAYIAANYDPEGTITTEIVNKDDNLNVVDKFTMIEKYDDPLRDDTEIRSIIDASLKYYFEKHETSIESLNSVSEYSSDVIRCPKLGFWGNPLQMKVIAEAINLYLDSEGMDNTYLKDSTFQIETDYQALFGLNQDNWGFYSEKSELEGKILAQKNLMKVQNNLIKMFLIIEDHLVVSGLIGHFMDLNGREFALHEWHDELNDNLNDVDKEKVIKLINDYNECVDIIKSSSIVNSKTNNTKKKKNLSR